MTLRWYQQEAVEETWRHLYHNPGNPVIVAPTGSGKSHIIAELCRYAIEKFDGRLIVLQHRKELIQQNMEKIAAILPAGYVGAYSAGLKSRATDTPVVCAGIQSVHRKADVFGERNLVLIDECHLISHTGEGMYRSFLGDLRSMNAGMRAIGCTATPFRLDSGPICRPNGIFQSVSYSVPVRQLIKEGFLSNLVTRPAVNTADTSELRKRAGEFIAADGERLFDAVAQSTCIEIVQSAAGRKSILMFCSGVFHAEHIAEIIGKLTGESCGVVTGNTLPIERMTLLSDFRSGKLRWLANCSVLTTGFDAPCIDMIAILRATASAGLFAQIVGRGLRIDPGKKDCLVLDFGQNIARHGPIDAIDYGRDKQPRTGEIGEAPVRECPNCGLMVLIQDTECECGYQFPPPESKLDSESDKESEILSMPERWTVSEVDYSKHNKRNAPDAPPTLRVTYTCKPYGSDKDNSNLLEKTHSEWVCIEHGGYAKSKAMKWWDERCVLAFPPSVDDAVEVARVGALAWPTEITTLQEGRWTRITECRLDDKPQEWLDEVPVEPNGFDEEVPF